MRWSLSTVETSCLEEPIARKERKPRPRHIQICKSVEQSKCLSCQLPGVSVFEIYIHNGGGANWQDWCRPCIELFANRSGLNILVGEDVEEGVKECKQKRLNKLKDEWEHPKTPKEISVTPVKEVKRFTSQNLGTTETLPKKRGRPKGSVNKPKSEGTKKKSVIRFTSMKRKR